MNQKHEQQHEQWSLIPELMTLMIQLFLVNQKHTKQTLKSDTELMTLMIQFFLVNQKYTTWTPKSDTQANDSYDPVRFSESKTYNTHTEVWASCFLWIKMYKANTETWIKSQLC